MERAAFGGVIDEEVCCLDIIQNVNSIWRIGHMEIKIGHYQHIFRSYTLLNLFNRDETCFLGGRSLENSI